MVEDFELPGNLSSQARRRKLPVPPVRTLSAGTMKMPLPIIDPAISMVEEKAPMWRWYS